LDPSLDLGDSLALSTRLPVHRVLETLDELLQVSDTVLEKAKYAIVRRRRGWWHSRRRAFIRPTDLPDPRDQALPSAGTHRLSTRLDRGARGGYRRRSASVILRITSDPLSTCARTIASFSARFSSARSRAVFTA
jgi:hypothetical protein